MVLSPVIAGLFTYLAATILVVRGRKGVRRLVLIGSILLLLGVAFVALNWERILSINPYG